MPKQYTAMRDEFKKEGLSDKKAKAKAAAIYNSKHKKHPVGRYTESTPYFNGLINEDKLPGGVDAPNLDKFLSKFDPEEVSKGIKVEMEHTKDRKLAAEIASDHLDEDPHYYSKLAKVHKENDMSKTPYFNGLNEVLNQNQRDIVALHIKNARRSQTSSRWTDELGYDQPEEFGPLPPLSGSKAKIGAAKDLKQTRDSITQDAGRDMYGYTVTPEMDTHLGNAENRLYRIGKILKRKERGKNMSESTTPYFNSLIETNDQHELEKLHQRLTGQGEALKAWTDHVSGQLKDFTKKSKPKPKAKPKSKPKAKKK